MHIFLQSRSSLPARFLDGDGVARPLMSLLDDPSDAVRAGASAALCNLVLEYVPLKEQIIKEGCLGERRSGPSSGCGTSQAVAKVILSS